MTSSDRNLICFSRQLKLTQCSYEWFYLNLDVNKCKLKLKQNCALNLFVDPRLTGGAFDAPPPEYSR